MCRKLDIAFEKIVSNKYEISSSHSGKYEAQNLLGCTAMFLMMEAARTPETSVDIQLRTRQYIPEESETLKMVIIILYLVDDDYL
jgi:hypothetical protein